MEGLSKEQQQQHWQQTKGLMVKILIIWFIFGFLIHLFVGALNQTSIFGFPLGYYMAAQGSLFAFVVIIFVFAHRQNKIDEDFGVAEHDD